MLNTWVALESATYIMIQPMQPISLQSIRQEYPNSYRTDNCTPECGLNRPCTLAKPKPGVSSGESCSMVRVCCTFKPLVPNPRIEALSAAQGCSRDSSLCCLAPATTRCISPPLLSQSARSRCNHTVLSTTFTQHLLDGSMLSKQECSAKTALQALYGPGVLPLSKFGSSSAVYSARSSAPDNFPQMSFAAPRQCIRTRVGHS